jgi:hypothetical protein
MTQILKIKRSTTTAAPSSLQNGELAYSANSDKLFIGRPGGGVGDIDAIGGKFFTDLLDHTAGTVTASSALIVDANSKLDVLNVDNITINGNEIVSTDTNGDLTLTPNGTGNLVLDGQNWPQADGIANYFLKTNGTGQLSWGAIPSGSFTLSDGLATDSFTTGETLTFTGGTNITTAVTNNEVTITGLSDSEIRGLFSVAGDLSYNSTTGEFSFTERTDAEVRGLLSASGDLSYNSTTGDFSFTDRTDAEVRGLLSVAGDLSYNSTTGEFSFTERTDAEVRGLLSASGDLSYNSTTGDFSFTDRTDAEVRGLLSASGDLSYNSTTGDFSFTERTDAEVRGLLSVTDAGGDGSLVYNSSTGVVTYTGPSAAETRAHFSATGGITYTSGTGVFTIADGAISNAKLASSSITVGSTSIALGAASTSLAGITELTVDNLNINGNQITSTDTNGDISLNPNGTGTVDVNSAIISNVATPVASTDAANKAYVDAVAEGLHVHAQAHALTDTSLATITGNTVTYNNGTSGVGATLTLATALDLAGGDIDGDTDISVGDRVIVNGEATAAHNGIYVITSTTVLTRAEDFDTPTEMAGGDFIFVTHGTTYANTGWVLGEAVSTVGTDAVDFVQFSGAGTYTAGSGLTLTGTEFTVNVASAGGIEISAGDLQLKSSLAGDGLSYAAGVLSVTQLDGGTF